MRSPRRWWKDYRRTKTDLVRSQGYADGLTGRRQRRVGLDGGRYQSVYDLAYSRGLMVARQRPAPGRDVSNRGT